MVDLETMGTRADAPILSIGAVAFDSKNGILGERYYTTIDLASAVKFGGRIDPSTVAWWMQQSEQARKDVLGGMQLDIVTALHDFSTWLHEKCAPKKAVRVWGNGADFDCTILSESYKRCGIEPPWEFWNSRCYRTIKAVYPNVEMKRTGTHHNALDDAISQAEHFILIRKTLQGKAA